MITKITASEKTNNIDEQIRVLKILLCAKSDSMISKMLGITRANTYLWKTNGSIPEDRMREAVSIALNRYALVESAIGKKEIAKIGKNRENIDLIVTAGLKISNSCFDNKELALVFDEVVVADSDLCVLYGVNRGTINMNITRDFPISKDYHFAKIGLAAVRIIDGYEIAKKIGGF